MADFTRRTFVIGSAAVGLWTRGGYAVDRTTVPEKIRVAVMGVNGRGLALAIGFAQQKQCEVTHVCDVDQRAVDRAVSEVGKLQERAPQGERDFRRVLDDKSLTALVIAAPDHWHAPAAILACTAGKHVYVEKPCCHNPHEGELLVEAARKHNRVVTMGNQRRSWPTIAEAMARLRDGTIGRVMFSRSWYNNRRVSIEKGKAIPVPEWLDWNLWQGPAPERPFRENIVHYNWHWFWDWGTGELGNNGVHGIDLCRWGLGVDFPIRVSAAGGKYRYNDDQETPDTQVVTFDFPENRSISWQGLSWCPRGFEGSQFGASFHGEQGSLVVLDDRYQIFGEDDKLAEEVVARDTGDDKHLADFLDAIRNGRPPNSPIDEAYKSSLLCCLGNIAYRTSSTLLCDPQSGRIAGNPAAEALWAREYRPGWQL